MRGCQGDNSLNRNQAPAGRNEARAVSDLRSRHHVPISFILAGCLRTEEVNHLAPYKSCSIIMLGTLSRPLFTTLKKMIDSKLSFTINVPTERTTRICLSINLLKQEDGMLVTC
jgi:hypothetical protein